jgi:hydrogenase maturation protease
VRTRLAEAVELAARQLSDWGLPGRGRFVDEIVEPLNARSLALGDYESGRPSEEDACRIGDPRLLGARGR